LELGGSDALIVCEDADPRLAAALCARGAFQNSGQRCTAVKRILVHAAIADEFVDHLVVLCQGLIVGPPSDPSTDVGTLISEAAAETIEALLFASSADSLALKGEVRRKKAQLWPIVIDHVLPTSCLVTGEVFGPIAPVIRFNSLEEAIAIANASAFGLSAGICSNEWTVCRRLIDELEVGAVNVWENPSYRSEASPFGGIKASGNGAKEGVLESILAFTSRKVYSLPW
jgi:acyl-CoA reductase-like NAD-dependent aldehyde dehydrogenase